MMLVLLRINCVGRVILLLYSQIRLSRVPQFMLAVSLGMLALLIDGVNVCEQLVERDLKLMDIPHAQEDLPILYSMYVHSDRYIKTLQVIKDHEK
jgi:hypothetical protein